MGLCFSCRKSRLESLKSEQFSASATPLHVCVEEQKGPEIGSSSKEICQYTKMANTISNIKMTNPVRILVSKRRKRYTQDGFNLDLTYIKSNLIAMGFPAQKLEGVYRNHIDDVVKFLESKHKDHYKIYNLCSERSYDVSKFQQRVSVYPFDDHNPPKMELIGPFCADVHEWLSQDPRNVAAVHCKAGKGRTGVMVCCYLLHSKLYSTANEALSYYAGMRTHDKKGVTIPSQRRYVGYYATLVQEELKYHPVVLLLKELRIEPLPNLNGGQCSLQVVISDSNKLIFTSPVYEVKKGSPSFCIPLDQSVRLEGDIKVQFFNKPKMKRKEKMFHFWFNTFFVREEIQVPDTPANGNEDGDVIPPPDRSSRAMSCDGQSHVSQLPLRHSRTVSLVSLEPDMKMLVLRLNKWAIDEAHKDKQNKLYSPDFEVTLYMRRVPSDLSASKLWQHTDMQQRTHFQDTPSESSEAESSDSDSAEDEDWESVDSAERRVGRYRLLSDSEYRHVNELFES
ncbi:phosphatidylinositol 3,4,5-trisphosphate 3-phosphatase and dual-specificity protein phosphatase PTEN isoform X1 [Schistocerca americana]|uniref:Phosphatidylinositol 3,4,5-trisphosphate 3-phosphatase and dual-specificity protein phosphatase PTEN n=1 Tax=Schistocerca gregaria TaxID=7010 RepID=A0A8E5NJ15_SCHGR|nr:phosphatidylinositol 3,4,5-trisphosphate 3-phosphatase and dual-specificity protein phosphatase PTEN isoform X1 [Schistocerca americana]XP_047105488.1 phosphatidylinositol 3,4,5-trisphosphate 3-phosphatase and dual-specificity protein phosphatase PTEN isoform X3 [Schistocerca piceifrons]XP_049773338.1 phosphatidylinositol 3,4,5-trisphosphate 3-phosphatase and dual-specificity protein phosphatase PTEN isoform X1 [Schistocerca cancellata]XP_049856351.1 phosphatidylinositol 3,4,5-trisphosphate 3